jgi:hypothetical protein
MRSASFLCDSVSFFAPFLRLSCFFLFFLFASFFLLLHSAAAVFILAVVSFFFCLVAFFASVSSLFPPRLHPFFPVAFFLLSQLCSVSFRAHAPTHPHHSRACRSPPLCLRSWSPTLVLHLSPFSACLFVAPPFLLWSPARPVCSALVLHFCPFVRFPFACVHSLDA